MRTPGQHVTCVGVASSALWMMAQGGIVCVCACVRVCERARTSVSTAHAVTLQLHTKWGQESLSGVLVAGVHM